MAVDVFSILHHYSRTLWSSVLGSRLGYGRVVHQRSLPMNSHPLPSSSPESRPLPLSIECALLDASTLHDASWNVRQCCERSDTVPRFQCYCATLRKDPIARGARGHGS